MIKTDTVLKRKKNSRGGRHWTKPKQNIPAPSGAECPSFRAARASHQVNTQTGAAPPLPGSWARIRHQLSAQQLFTFFIKFILKVISCSQRWWAFLKATLFSNSRTQILFHALSLACCPHNWLWCHQDSLVSEMFPGILVSLPLFSFKDLTIIKTDIFGDVCVCCRQILVAVRMSVNQTRQILGLAWIRNKFCVCPKSSRVLPDAPTTELVVWGFCVALPFLFSAQLSQALAAQSPGYLQSSGWWLFQVPVSPGFCK